MKLLKLWYTLWGSKEKVIREMVRSSLKVMMNQKVLEDDSWQVLKIIFLWMEDGRIKFVTRTMCPNDLMIMTV